MKDNHERITKMVDVIKHLYQQSKVFSSIKDMYRFRKLLTTDNVEQEPIPIHVKQTSDVVFARPGTSDIQVLWDTFYFQYHLPPKRLRRNCIIVDLGANVGYTLAHMAWLFPDSKILGVEMDSGNINIARINTRSLGERCRLIEAAVWERDGIISYGGEEEWGYRVNYDSTDQDNQVVSSVSLKSIFDKFDLSVIDYVKMDIEGSEIAVLASAYDPLQRVRMINVEVHPQFNSLSTKEECCKILTSYGFHCQDHTTHPMAIVGYR